jgi:hypothetical protein
MPLNISLTNRLKANYCYFCNKKTTRSVSFSKGSKEHVEQWFLTLRVRGTRVCCLRLTRVRHRKNAFTQYAV